MDEKAILNRNHNCILMRFSTTLFSLLLVTQVMGQQLNQGILDHFQYRNLGAYRVGAWISAIAVPESDDRAYAHTFYVAARNGGVWKTTNKGTTFEPIFDTEGVNAIGDIAVSPSDPETLWVGTGEDFNARSSYSGTGVYKSFDGGQSWLNMGLKDSHHISEIIIHPSNPDIVYVGVMGHLFSDNAQRGVYKTTDGGRSWKPVLQISETTGVIDLAIHPENPDIIYAVAYHMDRSPWHFEAGGAESGIYKTLDGGASWKQLKQGLPEGKIGRIGIDISLSDPNQLYAVVENLNMTLLSARQIAQNRERGIAETEREIGGEVYHSVDNGETWTKVNPENVDVSSKAAYSFNEIFINPTEPDNIFVLSETLSSSFDGGRSWNDANWPPRELFTKMFGDVRTMWINPKDSRHMMIGSDGGVYVSYDGGKTTDHLYNIPLGEIYNVAVDNEEPYNIYLGYQDHEVWKGPSNSWSGQVTLEDWTIVGLWDGMFTQVDPRDNRWVYVTSQFGAHHRIDQKTGTRKNIQPKPKDENKPYRYTWDTPILISPHDSKTLYTGGQMLLKSTDQGDSWEEISPDLTDNDPVKIAGKGHIQYCTITSIAESSLKKGLIWVGTDDGRVHMTSNGGESWTEVSGELTEAGALRDRWVSRVQASQHTEGIAYVTKSGYRRDDFSPFVYKTSDYGKTWKDISSNLPESPVSIIIEDHKNPNLLFVGNDIGVYVTVNGGASWYPLKGNMPSVPVRDLVIQPKANDLVVGTYGRGAFVTDISPLQELTNRVFTSDLFLFKIETKPVSYNAPASRWGSYELSGDRHLATPNEPAGMVINYYMRHSSAQPVDITIQDERGKEIDSFKGSSRGGINQAIWAIRGQRPGKYTVSITSRSKIVAGEGVLLKVPEYAIPNFRNGKR